MVGRLLSEAELCIQRIRRAARDKKVGPAVKVDAEHRCYQITSDMIQRMQGLGYLPTACRRIEADLVHHLDQIPELDDLHLELDRIKALTGEDGSDTSTELLQLEREFTKVQLAEKVAKVSADTKLKLNEKGIDDDIKQ